MLLKYQITEHRGATALGIYVVVGEALSTIYRRNSGDNILLLLWQENFALALSPSIVVLGMSACIAQAEPGHAPFAMRVPY